MPWLYSLLQSLLKSGCATQLTSDNHRAIFLMGHMMIAESQPQLALSHQEPFRGEIVVCDDEADICETLGVALEKRGYQALITHYGSECIRLAFQQKPKAILLDINLPDASGLDICEQLADSAQTCHIPVIMLSANGSQETVAQTRRNGARFFVRKPYDLNTVIAVMDRAIQDGSSW